ncbi:MAG: hypothetical protein D5S00_08990 [Tindallia sp. MSAO_Bac2]|nr:MAG: hypothetical protein D5S00_08990 [Tindallia sp. MSAO_Bac2]
MACKVIDIILRDDLVTGAEEKGIKLRKLKVTERVVKACFDNGLMIYPASGGINGVKGDAIHARK